MLIVNTLLRRVEFGIQLLNTTETLSLRRSVFALGYPTIFLRFQWIPEQNAEPNGIFFVGYRGGAAPDDNLDLGGHPAAHHWSCWNRWQCHLPRCHSQSKFIKSLRQK